jgi:uncharacterized membrane protein
MITRYHAIAASLISFFALFAVADTVEAFSSNVTFCNHTGQNADVAWGYDAQGTSETTSRGWKKVANCSCTDLFRAETRATEFWYLAVKSGSFEELSRGTGSLCVDPKAGFRFVNQNSSESSCRQAGGRWLKFAQDNTQGRSSHKLTLGNRCNQ